MRSYIVLVNYNGYKDSIECLESLLPQLGEQSRVVLVDNGSTDGSLPYLINWAEDNGKKYAFFDEKLLPDSGFHSLPEITLIKSDTNGGFAAGNNIALKWILNDKEWQWVWLLNNDTIVPPETIDRLFEAAALFEPRVGIAGTRIFNYYNRNVLESIGGKYNRRWATTRFIAAGETDYLYSKERFRKEVDYVQGASMLVKHQFLEEVGLMEERYFLYFEELDWITRGKRKGWIIDLADKVSIYHKGGSAISGMGSSSLLADICSLVNRARFTGKFYPQYLLFVYLSFLLVLFNRLRRNQGNRIPLLLKAMVTLKIPRK